MYDAQRTSGSTVPAPLDATALYGAGHLIGRDDLEAIFSTDAPTAAPIAAQIDRMRTILDRAAAQAAGLTTGHITDADTARDAQDRASEAEVEELRARELKERDDLLGVQREQIASLTAHNVELMREIGRRQQGGAVFVALDSDFDAVDAGLAVQRAVHLEARGARCGFKPCRDADGRIVGLSVGIARVADVAAIGRGEMAVTAGDEGDVVEQKEAA